MRRRLLLLFLPSIYASASDANDGLWNCAQSKDSKEWVCVGSKKTPEKAEEAKAPAAEQAVKDRRSKDFEVEQDTQPAVAEQPDINKSEPAPAVEQVELEPSPPKLPVASKADQKAARQAGVDPEQAAQPTSAGNPDPKKQLQTEANRPGWNCGAKATDKTWDCKLVGDDPKGQARVIETAESESSSGLLNPAFNHTEEQTFSNLKSQLKYDPWKSCAAPTPTKPSYVSEKNLRPTAPLDINSDYAEIFDNEIYSYVGNVEMTRADQRSVSNKASYDTVSETMDLQGSVYYSDDDLALHSESASLNLASSQARLREALFISPATPLRGRAKTIYRDSSTLSRYKDVAYTACRPGNQDWVVHASEMKLNKTTGQGATKNAWIEFKGTPVFYSPYLSFPTDDRRLSGFLAPSFGNTQRAGFSLSTPYYWNIAPNYDATLRPRLLSKRGVVLGGNFRYLTEMMKGNAEVEFLPHDSLRNKARYLTAIKNNTQFSPHISSNLDLNYVSDKDYFSELGSALSVSTYSSFLLSQANLGYANEGVALRGHVDNYQSIDKAITTAGLPYRRLPQVNLNLNHSFNFMPLNTLMDAEYVYFQHDSLVNGQRSNIKPAVSLPMQTASAFVMPKVSLQHTQYALNNPHQGTLSLDSTSRTLPIFSTDSGLYMEKEVDFSNRSYLHTLEPRLFYLYVPKADQSNIPIFDTALYDFSFNSMFLENRFIGTDRVQDANQVTAALTTRLIDAKTGRERLKLGVGEIAYFRDREVTLPGYPVETSKLSPLVTELNAELTEHVSISSGLQWDPHLNDVVRHKAAMHFVNQPGEIVNLGYRYRKNTLIPTAPGTRPYDIIQSDLSFHWPVYNDWYAVGRWTYSLLNNSTQESFFGVEKENCCWRFRVIGRRWINSIALTQYPSGTPQNLNIQNALDIDATGTSQTGVFFQVELKGLTGIGEKLDEFFEKQIYGYRKPKK